METNKNTDQSQDTQQKLTFINFDRYFWSKDYTKLFLVLPGNIVVPVHANFMKARVGMKYTPAPKKQKTDAPASTQAA